MQTNVSSDCASLVTLMVLLKWLSSLPVVTQKSGGESAVLGVISLFPHLLRSLTSPEPLQRQLGVKQVHSTNDVSPRRRQSGGKCTQSRHTCKQRLKCPFTDSSFVPFADWVTRLVKIICYKYEYHADWMGKQGGCPTSQTTGGTAVTQLLTVRLNGRASDESSTLLSVQVLSVLNAPRGSTFHNGPSSSYCTSVSF